MMERYMRAYAYLRVSTDEQDETNQLKDVRAYANELNLSIVRVFRERASAWKSRTRPIFSQMLKSARKQDIEHIVVWDFDRVERNRKRFIGLIRRLSREGIKLHSTRQRWIEELNSIPEPFNEIVSELMLQIVGWMAEEESSKRSERVRAAYERMNSEGKAQGWGRPPLTDYISIERMGELYIEAGSLRRACELIQREIRKRGKPTPSVSVPTIRKYLHELTGGSVNVGSVGGALTQMRGVRIG